jgi:hypothetical protein
MTKAPSEMISGTGSTFAPDQPLEGLANDPAGK